MKLGYLGLGLVLVSASCTVDGSDGTQTGGTSSVGGTGGALTQAGGGASAGDDVGGAFAGGAPSSAGAGSPGGGGFVGGMAGAPSNAGAGAGNEVGGSFAGGGSNAAGGGSLGGGGDAGGDATIARKVSADTEVIVTEIMWQAVPDEASGPDDGQFVELFNTTNEPLSIANCRFTGVNGNFYLQGTIAPHSYFLVGASTSCCGSAAPDDLLEASIWDRSVGSGQLLFMCEDPLVQFLPKFTRAFMQMNGLGKHIPVGHSQYIDCNGAWAPDSASYASGRFGTPRAANVCPP